MRNVNYWTVLIIAIALFQGCSTKNRVYTPHYFDVQVEDTEKPKALVKASGSIRIFKVDNKIINCSFSDKLKCFFSFNLYKIGVDSVVLSEGAHQISIKISIAGEIYIPKINFEAGNEYLIDSVLKKENNMRKKYFWIENLTTGKIVAGKKVT